jgi:hypothetical protein
LLAGGALLVTALGALTMTNEGLHEQIGSGVTVAQPRSVGAFHGIRLRNSVDVRFTQGPDCKVSLEGEDNLLDLVSTEVRGDVLVIDTVRAHFTSKRPILVYVSAPELRELDMEGSGNILVQGDLRSDELEIDLSGSGDIVAQGELGKVDCDLSGSGTLTLRGTAEDEQIQLAGSGTIDSRELRVARQCSVDLSGSGDCLIWTDGQLKVQLDGSGEVRYKGEPASLSSDIDGSGSLGKLE